MLKIELDSIQKNGTKLPHGWARSLRYEENVV